MTDDRIKSIEDDLFLEGVCQLPEESEKAYRAYSIYRDLGVGRTYARAWRKYQTEVLGKKKITSENARPYFCEWGSKYRWEDRAAAYHESLAIARAQKDRDRYIKELEDFSERAKTIGKNLTQMSNNYAQTVVKGLEDLRATGATPSYRDLATLTNALVNCAVNGIDLYGQALDVEAMLERYGEETKN